VDRVIPPVAGRRLDRFTGHIAGLGTTSGTRLVVGCWEHSPLGSFADVMVQRGDGHRVLLAPRPDVAAYVRETYTFDEVRVVPVAVERGPDAASWSVRTPELDLAFDVGGRHLVSWPLRAVPPGLRDSRAWARLCDPVARRLMPGVRTFGSAGRGREEWYAAREVRRIVAVEATWEGAPLGTLAPVDPPVGFGFGSAPATPTLTRIRTTVRVPTPTPEAA